MIILQTNNNEKRIDIMIHGDKEMLYDEFFRWHQSKKKLSTTIQFNTKIWNGYIFFLFTTQWKIKNGFYIYSKIYFSMQISTEFLQQIISRCFFSHFIVFVFICLFLFMLSYQIKDKLYNTKTCWESSKLRPSVGIILHFSQVFLTQYERRTDSF